MRTDPAATRGPTWETFTAALIGRHGAGRLAHALLGSTASRVLRASDRSVLVVPAGERP